MKPIQKSQAIEDLLTKLNGISREEALHKWICVQCRGPALLFKDYLSVEEYRISGLCQKCQDRIFDK